MLFKFPVQHHFLIPQAKLLHSHHFIFKNSFITLQLHFPIPKQLYKCFPLNPLE